MGNATKEPKKKQRSKPYEDTRHATKNSIVTLPTLDSLPPPPTPPNARQKPKLMTREARIKSIKCPQLVAKPEPTQVWCLGCNYPIQCDKRQERNGRLAYYTTNWSKHALICMRAFLDTIKNIDQCDEEEARTTANALLKAWKTTWTKPVALASEIRPIRGKAHYYEAKITKWRREIQATQVLPSVIIAERPADSPQVSDSTPSVDEDAFAIRPRRVRKEFFDNPAPPVGEGGHRRVMGMTIPVEVAPSSAGPVLESRLEECARLGITEPQLAVQPQESIVHAAQLAPAVHSDEPTNSPPSCTLRSASWRVVRWAY